MDHPEEIPEELFASIPDLSPAKPERDARLEALEAELDIARLEADLLRAELREKDELLRTLVSKLELR